MADENARRLRSSGDHWCIHRTPFGSDHLVCKVGIDFHPFLKPGDRMDNMPCLGTPSPDEAVKMCPRYVRLTDEELEADRIESKAQCMRMGIIRRAIIKSGKSSGEIECPACKTGTVRFSVARCNGHVHARCSTDGCAEWME